MKQNSGSLTEEAQFPPLSTIAVLLTLALTLVWFSDEQPHEARLAIYWLIIILYLLCMVTWLMETLRTGSGSWFAVLALVALILLGNHWLPNPEILSLLIIPVGVAGAVINPSAAVYVAVAATIGVIVISPHTGLGTAPNSISVAVLAVWTMAGTICAIHYPREQVCRRMDQHARQVQERLTMARVDREELTQTLALLELINRQLSLANERAEALRLIAEDARRAKSVFVSKVSHEFRTPLNMILGLVELMVESPQAYAMPLPPEMEQDLVVVLRNCRHLSSLIDDVLDLTQIEAERVVLHQENVDLSDVVNEAAQAILPLLKKKDLMLQISLPDDPPLVYCDRTRIRQVVLNLLSNAARFTETGGIWVSLSAEGSRMVVRVRDTGPGISREDAESIFEPFCQGRSRPWRDTGGSGLGLSISRQFVELHHGRLWLESELGSGSTFVFTLPLALPAEPLAGPNRWVHDDWVWREKTINRRIQPSDRPSQPRLIVSDADGTLCDELARFGDEIEMVQVKNLYEAAEEIERSPADAFLIGVARDGKPLVDILDNARREIPTTPIVACSIPRRLERAVSAGAIGYLVKPISLDALQNAIAGMPKPVRRILIIDDDADVLSLFTRMLHSMNEGFLIETAFNGNDGLDRIRNTSFDLLLLDIILPDMDGWQVLDRLKAEGRLEDLAVCIVSAQDPADQPPLSPILAVTIGEGLSIKRVLRCALDLSELLLSPEGMLDLAPQQIAEPEPASTESPLHPAQMPILPL